MLQQGAFALVVSMLLEDLNQVLEACSLALDCPVDRDSFETNLLTRNSYVSTARWYARRMRVSKQAVAPPSGTASSPCCPRWQATNRGLPSCQIVFNSAVGICWQYRRIDLVSQLCWQSEQTEAYRGLWCLTKRLVPSMLHVRDVCEVEYGTMQQGGFYSCWF
ncbi:hypothetical protein J3E74DRAFT_365661 [Bipolaris maydis]|nr:hypothetical protein J3E74DRAFT_365661 [Bipolaris maydis]